MEEIKFFEIFQNISDSFSNLRKNLQACFQNWNLPVSGKPFAAVLTYFRVFCFFSDFVQKLPDFAKNLQLRRHIFIYRVWDFFEGKEQEMYFLYLFEKN